VKTGPVQRRRVLLAAMLALALLLPWLQQGALRHAFGHAPGPARHAVAAVADAHPADAPGHDGTCAACIAFAAFLACPPAAAMPSPPLLATGDDLHVAAARPAAATAPRAWPNRGPPGAA
jgi:hypothetical protein